MRRMILPSLLLSALVSSAQKYQFGSSVVALKTKDEIVVAADGKALGVLPVQINGVMTYQKKIDTTCKIHRVGNAYFGYAGRAGDIIDNIVLKNASNKATIPEMIYAFEPEMKNFLTSDLEDLRLNKIQLYKEMYSGKDTINVIDMIFFKFENDLPIVNEIVFWRINKDTETVKIVSDTSVKLNPNKEFGLLAVGEVSVIKRSSPYDIQASCEKEGKAFTAKNLLVRQHEPTPDLVGPPIIAIILKPNFVEWRPKKNICN